MGVAFVDSVVWSSATNGRPGWFGRELDERDLLQVMAAEARIIYEFVTHRTYGMY